MKTRPSLRTAPLGIFLCSIITVPALVATLTCAPAATAADPAIGPPVLVASGNAYRGPWRGNDSEFDFVDDAAVAVNDEGFVAVAWADLPRQDIFLRLYDPAGKAVFEDAVNVSRSTRIFSWIPKLAISNGDSPDKITIYCIWQDIVFRGGSHGGEIFTAASRNGGRDFEAPINLSDAIEGSGKGRSDPHRWHNGSYDLFVCPKGVVHAAWTEYEGRLWYSHSQDGGRSFSKKLHVAGGPGGATGALPTRGPSLAADGDGAVFLAYTVGDVPDADIHLLISRDGGKTFADPLTTPPSARYADAPSIALDSKGTLHLVYADCDGGAEGRPRLMHVRLAKGADAFGQPRALFEGSENAAHFPVLHIDAQDRLYLAWEHYPEFPGRPRGIGFSQSHDGGATFSPPRVVAGLGGPPELGFNGSQQGLLGAKFSASRSGRLAFANSLFRPGKSSRILFVTGPRPTDQKPGSNADDGQVDERAK